MIVGIIAEGRGDLAVLTNVLKGWLSLDRENVRYLLPEYDQDETDLHTMRKGQYSNWGHVKSECEGGQRIRDFFDNQIDDERLLVIHIDAAESELPGYDVPRGSESGGVVNLRDAIIKKINEWSGSHLDSRVRYAIAIEETDAWVLTLHADKKVKDTAKFHDAKRRLELALNKPGRLNSTEKKRFFQKKTFDRYDWLTTDFRKRKTLERSAERNHSLCIFLESMNPPSSD